MTGAKLLVTLLSSMWAIASLAATPDKVEVRFDGSAVKLENPKEMRNTQKTNRYWDFARINFDRQFGYRNIGDKYGDKYVPIFTNVGGGDKNDTIWQTKLDRSVIESLILADTQPKYLILSYEAKTKPDYMLQQKSIMHQLQNMETEQKALCLAFDDVVKNQGKKITTDVQREIIPMIAEREKDEKVRAEILKDFNKGKISKKILPQLQKEYELSHPQYLFAKEMLEVLENSKEKDLRNNLEYAYIVMESGKYTNNELVQGVSPAYTRLFENYEKKYVTNTFNDTVPNPFLPSEIAKIPYNRDIRNQFLIEAAVKPRWGALYSEKGELKEESYPLKISYTVYPTLQEYRINTPDDGQRPFRDGKAVYDAGGKLKAVILGNNDFNLNSYDNGLNFSKPIGKKAMALSYNENALNIKAAPASTKSFLTLMLGLREETAAEKKATDAAANMFGEALAQHATADAKHGRNTKAARREKEKAGTKGFLALLGSMPHDEAGERWMTQIEKEWVAKADGSTYDVKVINDLSYDVTYYDKSGKAFLNVVYKFKQGVSPYTLSTSYTVTAR